MKRLAVLALAVALASPAHAKSRYPSPWNEAPTDARTLKPGQSADCAKAIQFWDGDVLVGTLRWDGGIARFTGHTDKAAKNFFERCIKDLIQPALDAKAAKR